MVDADKDLEKFEGRGKEIVPAVHQDLQEHQESFFATIERLASRPDVDVAKIEKFMEMQERILDRNAKQAYNAAMVQAQSNMPVVPRDKWNEHTKSYYSGYETLVTYTQPVYSAHGFSVSFSQGFGTEENPLPENHIRVVADIMHRDGHTIQKFADIPHETTGAKGGQVMTKTHAQGSAFSYGRSYLMKLIWNIPTGLDDNGQGAGGGAIEFLDDKRQNTIVDTILDLEVDETKFYAFLSKATGHKIESVDQIPLKEYDRAMIELKRMKKPKQKNFIAPASG